MSGLCENFDDDDEDSRMSVISLYRGTRASVMLKYFEGKFIIKKKYNLSGDVFLNNYKIAYEYIDREIKALRDLRHPCVIQLIESKMMSKQKKGQLYVDFATSGSLEEILVAEDRDTYLVGWDETQKFIVCYGIARLLRFIESKNYIYRDLKPDNILLDHQYRPLLSDFDSARQILLDTDKIALTRSGTAEYCAPEQLLKSSTTYDSRATVYSFGLVIYAMFTLMRPYYDRISIEIPEKEKLTIAKIIELSTQLRFPDDFEYDELSEFAEKCWKMPEERPKIMELADNIERIFYLYEDLEVERFEEYKKYVDECEKDTSKIKIEGTLGNLKEATTRNSPLALKCMGFVHLGLTGLPVNKELVYNCFQRYSSIMKDDIFKEESLKYIGE